MIALSQLTGCRRRDRSVVLAALAREVVSDLARDMQVTSRSLHDATRSLYDSPSSPGLVASRQSFRAAALSWKRASTFREGPFVSSQGFQRAAFWPARSSAIRAVLGSTEDIDESRVEALGVEARGLFALEYLLFERSLEQSLLAGGRSGERARRYANELSANVLGYASRISRQLGDATGLAQTLKSGDRASVTLLVAQLRDTLEIVKGKFARAERAIAEQTPLEAAIEGHYSGLSVAIASAMIEGAERLYAGAGGGGLCDLVQNVAPAIDEHVVEAFAVVTRRLDGLPPALDVAVREQPAAFAAACAALETLAHIVHVEMASALES